MHGMMRYFKPRSGEELTDFTARVFDTPADPIHATIDDTMRPAYQALRADWDMYVNRGIDPVPVFQTLERVHGYAVMQTGLWG